MTTSKLKNHNHVVEKMLHFLYAEDILRNPYPGKHHVLANHVMSWFTHQRSNTFAKPYYFLVTFKLYPRPVTNLFTLDYT